MRLSHAPGSPHSAAVRIALAEKGLAYEERRLDLARFEHCAPDYLELQPSGLVPLLEDGACTIREALFILLYLDEAYPDPSLGGADPRARYQVHKWGKYAQTHIAPHLALLRWADGAGALPPAEALDRLAPERRALWDRAGAGFAPDEVDNARRAVENAAARLAADLATHDWLAGDDFTLADIAIYPHAARLAAAGIAPAQPLASWLARMSRRPSVAADALSDCEVVTMGPERGRWG